MTVLKQLKITYKESTKHGRKSRLHHRKMIPRPLIKEKTLILHSTVPYNGNAIGLANCIILGTMNRDPSETMHQRFRLKFRDGKIIVPVIATGVCSLFYVLFARLRGDL